MWQKFKASFRNSETIIWSRLQVVLGVVGSIAITVIEVLARTDLSPLIPDPKYLVLWLVVSGLITEALRHRRETWKDDAGTDSPPPGPAGS
jgi:hypothetical protein